MTVAGDERTTKSDWTDQDLLTKDVARERLEEAIAEAESAGATGGEARRRLRVMREQLATLRDG